MELEGIRATLIVSIHRVCENDDLLGTTEGEDHEQYGTDILSQHGDEV
jgi:hypothetical protein